MRSLERDDRLQQFKKIKVKEIELTKADGSKYKIKIESWENIYYRNMAKSKGA